MIQINRAGINFSENFIDPLLSFENAQTWTVSSGTGSVTTSDTYAFEGEKSLKLENTAPTTDLVVTNSAQSTVLIMKLADYDISFYVRKENPSDAYSGNVKIFKNAVLLDTQTWSLADTEDGQWYRFVTDATYTFAQTDIITFTFQFDGNAGFVGAKQVYIDGLMLGVKERLDSAPAKYTLPQDGIGVNQLKEVNGWGNYSDAETTPATQTFNTTASKLQIDGGGSSTNENYLPLEIKGSDSLWDIANDKITPINIGDSYSVRLDFEVTGETGSPTDITIQLDIGGDVTPTIPIVTRYSTAGKSTPYNVSIAFPIFCLSTFKTNGGQIFIDVDTGSITVASRGIFITRLSSGNIT